MNYWSVRSSTRSGRPRSSSNDGSGSTTPSDRTVRSDTNPRLRKPFKLGLSATLRSAKRPSLIQQKPNITLGVMRGGRSNGATIEVKSVIRYDETNRIAQVTDSLRLKDGTLQARPISSTVVQSVSQL